MIRVIFKNSEFGTYIFKKPIVLKNKDSGNQEIYDFSSFGLDILNQKVPISDLLHGSFCTVSKIVSIDHTQNDKRVTKKFVNRVTPFIRTDVISLPLALEKSINEEFLTSEFIFFLHRSKREESYYAYTFGADQRMKTYEVEKMTLVPLKMLPIKLEEAQPMIFSESFIILSGKSSVISINLLEKDPQNQVSELLFDKGLCNNFMAIRHTQLPAMFMCKVRGNLEMYSADDMLAGFVGVSRINVILKEPIDFSHIQLRYFNDIQDYFYGITANNEYLIFKIDAYPHISISLVHKHKINTKNIQISSVYDFIKIGNKVAIYAIRKRGADKRINLIFYHILNAETFRYTKAIELDYYFSPSPDNTRIMNYQSIRTDKSKVSEFFRSLLLIKVQQNYATSDNVLFIDPNSTKFNTIPSLLFNFESQVRIKIGLAISTNIAYLDSSISIAYHPVGKPEELLIERLVVKDLKLRLADAYELQEYGPTRLNDFLTKTDP